MTENREYDVYRHSYIRYLGYANEVGEAFRPLVHRNFVNASYGIAIAYVLGDVYDKSSNIYERSKSIQKTATTAGDVFLWQMLASVVIPGFTINRITWTAGMIVKKLKVKGIFRKVIPTALGLLSIPIIIHPIDRTVDALMDNTYRKLGE